LAPDGRGVASATGPGSVEGDDLASLDVFEVGVADVGQLLLHRVGDGDRHEIVLTLGDAHRLFVGTSATVDNKVGDEKGDRAAPRHLAQKLETNAQIGAPRFGLKRQYLGNQRQNVLLTFFRRDESFDL